VCFSPKPGCHLDEGWPVCQHPERDTSGVAADIFRIGRRCVQDGTSIVPLTSFLVGIVVFLIVVEVVVFFVVVEVIVFLFVFVVEILVFVLVVFDFLLFLFVVKLLVERLTGAIAGLLSARRADAILDRCAARSAGGAST
jgi:hypothetical protein